ncbi:Uncharacterised protein [Mycobacteroides abscessus subsp. abscessus]|nr:Uncharacterised protein [Mycobacteroides abscessus subsp. abscessus]
MPATGERACSLRTKVFQAARNGLGSEVTMTVSSMSEMIPNAESSPMIRTAAESTSEPSVHSSISVSPGVKWPGMTVSMIPPRSEVTMCSSSLMRTHAVSLGSGTLTNDRQPRTLACASADGWPSGVRTSRARTRTQSVLPYVS